MRRFMRAGVQKIIGPDHQDSTRNINNQGVALHQQGKYDEAEILHRSALGDREKALGLDHRDTLNSVNNLGATLHCQGKHDEAEIMHRRALRGREKTPSTRRDATCRNTLGETLLDLKRYSEGEAICRRALAGREKTLGPDHRDTLLSVNNLGLALRN
ncbi:unnamed protein product [Tuber melanosporum]|uniref:(Perigord truffle) hypothetical protein n=1 Tax=Tuber melanosporum (strain Mel28) TaxID=656061 RepID=D5GHE0_TUBMM|nr:uncharacterized protein GSTUM_00007822001 [Tuber melanosporum]CAZ83933.1 unnamed protein product [Tuber melanosporum]